MKTAIRKLKNAHDYVYERRKEPRFTPEDFAFAILYFEDTMAGGRITESVQKHAMILDWSESGCSLVVQHDEERSGFLSRGFRCTIRMNQGETYRAIVRWREVLNDRILNAGFEFL